VFRWAYPAACVLLDHIHLACASCACGKEVEAATLAGDLCGSGGAQWPVCSVWVSLDTRWWSARAAAGGYGAGGSADVAGCYACARGTGAGCLALPRRASTQFEEAGGSRHLRARWVGGRRRIYVCSGGEEMRGRGRRTGFWDHLAFTIFFGGLGEKFFLFLLFFFFFVF